MFIKSNPDLKGKIFIRALLICLLLFTFSAASIPMHAGGPGDKAKQASADWKAAQEAVKKVRAKLDEKRKKLQDVMAGHVESAKKKKKKDEPSPDDPALAQARKEVAEAEEALAAAEKNELLARVALEKAIAELEDGPLKDQLKRERDYPTEVYANGLHTINFETKSGKLSVNLPDDIQAGDTISGTVIAEPKGDTAEEKAKNQSVLNGTVIDLGGTKIQAGHPTFTWTAPVSQSGAPPRYLLKIIYQGQDTPYVMQSSSYTVNPKAPPDPNVTPTFNIPPLGQTGRAIVITGPFDGNSSNTQFDSRGLGGGTVIVGDWNSLNIVAESPRKTVVQAPVDSTGPTEIRVNENGAVTISNFRNVAVTLTAPKTTLQKGESTTLKVEVQGLQGITQPVPLHLTKGGVVNMQGGDAQTMSIRPADVSSNGTFTTTRTITGVQAGGWNATATVVVYDVCIQDDGDPLRVLLFMRETGDYKFCPGGSGVSGNPGSMDFSGGVSLATGDLNKVGAGVLTYQGNNQDRRVLINLSAGSFSQSGNVTIQTSKPKQTFTITDRDTRNNTCTCR